MAASLFHHTPSLRSHDPRLLLVRQVEYLRQIAGEPAQALISQHQYDPAGRVVTQRDPRLLDNASQPNLQTIYRLDTQPLRIDSVDAGWRLMLPGLAGEEQQRWDQRGNHWQYEHDLSLRVIAVTENAQVDVERYVYADHNADPGHNLRGELSESADRAHGGGRRLQPAGQGSE